MAVAFSTVGAIAANATTTTLAIVAPTFTDTDNKNVLIAAILGKDNQTITAPGGWTKFVEVNNTANQRTTLAWKRAAPGDSGATFNFTKGTDNNLLFCGVIAVFSGCLTSATPIDASTPTTSANASSDTVTYADFNPTETSAYVVAVGTYNNDLTTAGTISGTDPTLTNRWDLETGTGSDGSIFGYSGASSGAATGARSHSTTSTADDVNTGVLFGLVEEPVLGTVLPKIRMEPAQRFASDAARADIKAFPQYFFFPFNDERGRPVIQFRKGQLVADAIKPSPVSPSRFDRVPSFPFQFPLIQPLVVRPIAEMPRMVAVSTFFALVPFQEPPALQTQHIPVLSVRFPDDLPRFDFRSRFFDVIVSQEPPAPSSPVISPYRGQWPGAAVQPLVAAPRYLPFPYRQEPPLAFALIPVLVVKLPWLGPPVVRMCTFQGPIPWRDIWTPDPIDPSQVWTPDPLDTAQTWTPDPTDSAQSWTPDD